MSCNGRVIEYTGPSSGYLIRIRDGEDFVTVATRHTLRQVEAYARRLLRRNIPFEDMRFYRTVNWKPGFYQ